MDSLTQLQPGYYGNLSRYPFHNHVRGGLSWSGNGVGCNTLQVVAASRGAMRVAALSAHRSLEALVEAADAALYRAKRSGRNRFVEAGTREGSP